MASLKVTPDVQVLSLPYPSSHEFLINVFFLLYHGNYISEIVTSRNSIPQVVACANSFLVRQNHGTEVKLHLNLNFGFI